MRRYARVELRRGEHVEVDAVGTTVRPIKRRERDIRRRVVRLHNRPRDSARSEVASALAGRYDPFAHESFAGNEGGRDDARSGASALTPGREVARQDEWTPHDRRHRSIIRRRFEAQRLRNRQLDDIARLPCALDRDV